MKYTLKGVMGRLLLVRVRQGCCRMIASGCLTVWVVVCVLSWLAVDRQCAWPCHKMMKAVIGSHRDGYG